MHFFSTHRLLILCAKPPSSQFIRDHYAPKFPELESLVLNALDYVRTVSAIGNEMDITKVDLQPILPSATIMVVTVTGTTTNGRQLTDDEWRITKEACNMVLELDAARKMVIYQSSLNYVNMQSRLYSYPIISRL